MDDIEPYQLNALQNQFGCCGVEKFTDYLVLWKWWGIDAVRDFTQTSAEIEVTIQPGFAPTAPPKSRSKVKWQKLPIKISMEGDLELLPEQLEKQPKKIWQTYTLSEDEEEEPTTTETEIKMRSKKVSY